MNGRLNGIDGNTPRRENAIALTSLKAVGGGSYVITTTLCVKQHFTLWLYSGTPTTLKLVLGPDRT